MFVSHNHYSVYVVPDSLCVPANWITETISGYVIHCPRTIDPIGPLLGEHSLFGQRRAYYWPPIILTATWQKAVANRPLWAVNDPYCAAMVIADNIMLGYCWCGGGHNKQQIIVLW